MKLVRTVEGDLNDRHYCYQQYYRGICVEGGEYRVHADKSGMVGSTNGNLVENLKQEVKPKLSPEKALAVALKSVNATLYAWQDTAWEHQIRLDLEDEQATYYPKGEIVFARRPAKDDYEKDSYVLAYKFDITSIEPFQHLAVYVEADQEKWLKSISLIHEGTGNTLYNGTQSFATDHAGLTNWRLHANLPGAEHHTKASSGSGPGSTAWWLVSEYKDGDNNWGNSDRHPLSAHWAAERAWSYYVHVHARAGMFNGYKLRIHPRSLGGGGYNRANGYENIYIENGWSTLDIMGHEYTHGVVRASAGLVYERESGALDESFADIFGVAIERDAGGGLDWTVGENRGARTRNFQDPADVDPPFTPQPSIFGGARWVNPGCANPNRDNDWCGVHTNSGVQNHWFFLLSQGGTQNGVTVAGIGFDNAIRIVYRNLTAYLTSTSTYANARAGSINVANDLFGTCSAQARAVTNAWAAVGVGAAAGACTPPISLNISGSSSLNLYEQGSWTANASGGTGTYTYRWSMRTAQTGGWVNNVSTSRTYAQRIYPGDDFIEVQVNVTSGTAQRAATRYVYCNDCNGNFNASVYPNPAVDEINVELEGVQAGELGESIISLYNDNGNRFYQQESQGLKGQIDTRHLPPGTYYLEVANKAGILRKRIRIEGK